jgi:hypothetical protein
MIDMMTSDGYCLITSKHCAGLIKCSQCDVYKKYKAERRHGPNEWD